MPPEFAQQELDRAGAVGTVAGPLFASDGYLLAFELTSILLLVAIVGAVVIGKRSGTRGGADAR
jgi:NADH:ubiquinone oxidoreductase subunit 6 (subunit J)